MQDVQQIKEQREAVPNRSDPEAGRHTPDQVVINPPTGAEGKRDPKGRNRKSNRVSGRIREGDALTSAGIEPGQSQSEVPKARHEDSASFGSE